MDLSEYKAYGYFRLFEIMEDNSVHSHLIQIMKLSWEPDEISGAKAF